MAQSSGKTDYAEEATNYDILVVPIGNDSCRSYAAL
jgi:hypothetical protein